MLPPFFEWDDYGSCIQNGNEYCKVQGILQVPASNTTLFNFFQERKNNNFVLDPSLIYRAICMDKQEVTTQNITTIHFLSNAINKKLEMYHVSSQIENFVCTDGKAHINNYDIFILIGVILYTLLILYASFYNEKTSITGIRNFVSHFSLYKSWKNKTDISKIKQPHLNSFRFVSLFLVILIHMSLQWNGIYVENPNFLSEIFMTHPYTIYHRKLLTVTVLSFFLISSWLATVRIHRIFKDHGELSLKNIGIILINRYFRYIAAPIFIILTTSNWKYLFSGPVNFDILHQSDETCKNYWWRGVLCFSNFYFIGNICNKHIWFLSADFQMYVINILLHYVIFRKKLNIVRTYGIFFLASCCLHGCILYRYHIGTGFTPTIRSMFTYYFNKSVPFLIGYTSTFANVSSSFIGVIVGYIYFTYSKDTFFPSHPLILLWNTSITVVPLLALHLSSAEGKGWFEAVLGSICRPMYTLGAGILLLGISFNFGGVLKTILHNRFLVILGNFSFSIYVSHFIICQFAYISAPPRISTILLVMDYLKITAISIAVGIVFGLVVEEPCGSLQICLLPQVKKSEKTTK